ncbi:MAG TPA: RagB/SusD family nutrient uptake outer membrane protein [Arachidicoccus sp.]|nr:RagB/SusD family nutrient uptake outer membrane protein [Arachidicoccus sp.]
MKKYLIIPAIVIITAVILTACSKGYLNPPAQATPEQNDSTYTDPAGAAKFVAACYTNLLQWNQSAFSWLGVASITSDDADKGSDPGDLGGDKDQMDAITYSATSGSISDAWTGNYNGVSNCNQAILNVGLYPTLDQGLKNRYIAEAKFLRAYYYFNLVRMFGDIPLIDTVMDSDKPEDVTKASTRVPAVDIYAFIEKDLHDAMAVLPTNTQQAAKDVGHATKGSAAGLLAKVSLYEKKWQEAFDLSKGMMTGAYGTYGLVPDYGTIWRETGENSMESVFEVQSKIGVPDAGAQQYTAVQGMRAAAFKRVGNSGSANAYTGWGFNVPSANLDAAYEPGDKRRKATIIHIGDTLFDGVILISAANPMYNYKSYVSKFVESYDGDDDNTNKNIRLLRMGDIVLINAEAANELGITATAISSLNMVRKRAGLSGTGASSQADLRMAIWKERRVELAMECDRFFDLIRQGRAAAVLNALGKHFTAGKNEVFPIPQVEIDATEGKMIQNPGYN